MAKIQQFLGNPVLKKAATLKRLTMQLNQILPTHFIGQCQIADVSGEQITIAVASPAWSSQIRYYLPAIKKSFPYQHIRIMVNPGINRRALHTDQPRPGRQLDSDAARSIANTAKGIRDDKLKNAMLRLAKHGTGSETEQD